jgi:hypothetical protein
MKQLSQDLVLALAVDMALNIQGSTRYTTHLRMIQQLSKQPPEAVGVLTGNNKHCWRRQASLLHEQWLMETLQCLHTHMLGRLLNM